VGEGPADAHDELTQPDRKAVVCLPLHVPHTDSPTIVGPAVSNQPLDDHSHGLHLRNFFSGFMTAAETITRTLSQKPMVLLRPLTS
jgi:hypothetical protein